MSKKKEIFKVMQAKLEDQSTKDGSGSASKPSSQDPPFKTPQPKQRTKGASPGEAETRPRKRKKEGATEHSWPDNERILTNALQELELEQPQQAVSATMQDVVRLPVTLSERRSAGHRQEAYLAFSLYAIKRTGVALNQVTIETAYAAFREKQGLPGNDSHKNWFSENPVWLAALWKRAGVVVEEH